MSILNWNGSISLSDAIFQARQQGQELYIEPGSYDLGFTAITDAGSIGERPVRIYATPRTVTLNFTSSDLFFGSSTSPTSRLRVSISMVGTVLCQRFTEQV